MKKYFFIMEKIEFEISEISDFWGKIFILVKVPL